MLKSFKFFLSLFLIIVGSASATSLTLVNKSSHDLFVEVKTNYGEIYADAILVPANGQKVWTRPDNNLAYSGRGKESVGNRNRSAQPFTVTWYCDKEEKKEYSRSTQVQNAKTVFSDDGESYGYQAPKDSKRSCPQ